MCSRTEERKVFRILDISMDRRNVYGGYASLFQAEFYTVTLLTGICLVPTYIWASLVHHFQLINIQTSLWVEKHQAHGCIGSENIWDVCASIRMHATQCS